MGDSIDYLSAGSEGNWLEPVAKILEKMDEN
jgi:hypothetical protein